MAQFSYGNFHSVICFISESTEISLCCCINPEFHSVAVKQQYEYFCRLQVIEEMSFRFSSSEFLWHHSNKHHLNAL